MAFLSPALNAPTAAANAPIEVPSYKESFPCSYLNSRLVNLVHRMPQEEAIGEVSYLLLKWKDFQNLDPDNPNSKPNAELRSKLSACVSPNGSGLVVLQGQRTQIPPDVWNNVVQISTHLNIGELDAIALYVEAAGSYKMSTVGKGKRDPCQVSVELFYEEKISLLKGLMCLLPALCDPQFENATSGIRSLLMDPNQPIFIVKQMYAIIAKYVPIYDSLASSRNERTEFSKLRCFFVQQVLHQCSSIIFYLSYGFSSLCRNDVDMLNGTLQSLRSLSQLPNSDEASSCEFVVSKLALSCVNCLFVEMDSSSNGSTNRPVLDLRQILSDVEGWSGESESVRGVLISSYAIYLDSIVSQGGDRLKDGHLSIGLHIDELNKYLREGYEFCIFSYIRSRLLPSLVKSNVYGISMLERKIYMGIVVDFVGQFTLMAAACGEPPQTLAEWKEDRDYNAQLNNIQQDYSDRDDVLEDIVELIIDLCSQEPECALRFFNAEQISSDRMGFTLSTFLYDICLPVVSSELSMTLLVALCFDDSTIVAVHNYLQSNTNPSLSWDKLLDEASLYSQKRYYNSFENNLSKLNVNMEAYKAKVVLALVSRCAQNKSVRDFLLRSPKNVPNIVQAFPHVCLENLCAVANLIVDQKHAAMGIEWLDSMTISNPDVLTTCGLLILYDTLVCNLKNQPEGGTPINISSTTRTFMSQLAKWAISDSNDACLLFYALKCFQNDATFSSDQKNRVKIIQLFIRSSPSTHSIDQAENKLSPFLTTKNYSDLQVLLFEVLRSLEGNHVIMNIEHVLPRLAELLLNEEEVISSAALSYLKYISHDKNIQQFVFKCTEMMRALSEILSSLQVLDCVEILHKSLPTSLSFISSKLSHLVSDTMPEEVTSMLWSVRLYSGKDANVILSVLFQSGVIIQALSRIGSSSLKRMTDLLNLYVTNLFVKKSNQYDEVLCLRLLQYVTYTEKKATSSETGVVLQQTNGEDKKESLTSSVQADYNCAIGRLLALLSTDIFTINPNRLVQAILRSLVEGVQNGEVTSNCFYPISLGLMDLCLKYHDVLMPANDAIVQSMIAILSTLRGISGVDFLALVMTKFANGNSAKLCLELLSTIYDESGVRSHAIISSILDLLDLVEMDSVDYISLNKLAKSEDISILSKLAKDKDVCNILIQSGAPLKLIRGLPSVSNDPTVIVPALQFLLLVQMHYSMTPEIAQILKLYDSVFRHLIQQFPYFADVTEVFLQALVVCRVESIDEVYTPLVVQLMSRLIEYPFPRECMHNQHIQGLGGDSPLDAICWWDAFPQPSEHAYSLPIPPINQSHKATMSITWTNEHYTMATAASRILDLCTNILVKVLQSNSSSIVHCNIDVFARGLCRFVDLCHALENYRAYLKQRIGGLVTPATHGQHLELSFIEGLGPIMARFSERLITFFALYLKVKQLQRMSVENVREIAGIVYRALTYCQLESSGIGFSNLQGYNNKMVEEEKKQTQGFVDTSSKSPFGKKAGSILKDLIENSAAGIGLESKTHSRNMGLLPRSVLHNLK